MANQPNTTRRSFLSSAALLTASAAATGALASCAVLPVFAEPEPAKPTPEDLTRYYAFLWTEFHALAAELGVDFCDSYTAHRNGDVTAVSALCVAPPSSRAAAVLAAAKVERSRLVHASGIIKCRLVG